MKKSELRSLIRECITEVLTEAQIHHLFRQFVQKTVPKEDREEFVELFGPFLLVPLTSGHEVEDVSAQMKKIDSVIKMIPLDKKSKYLPILNNFKKFVSEQPTTQPNRR